MEEVSKLTTVSLFSRIGQKYVQTVSLTVPSCVSIYLRRVNSFCRNVSQRAIWWLLSTAGNDRQEGQWNLAKIPICSRARRRRESKCQLHTETLFLTSLSWISSQFSVLNWLSTVPLIKWISLTREIYCSRYIMVEIHTPFYPVRISAKYIASLVQV